MVSEADFVESRCGRFAFLINSYGRRLLVWSKDRALDMVEKGHEKGVFTATDRETIKAKINLSRLKDHDKEVSVVIQRCLASINLMLKHMPHASYSEERVQRMITHMSARLRGLKN